MPVSFQPLQNTSWLLLELSFAFYAFKSTVRDRALCCYWHCWVPYVTSKSPPKFLCACCLSVCVYVCVVTPKIIFLVKCLVYKAHPIFI